MSSRRLRRLSRAFFTLGILTLALGCSSTTERKNLDTSEDKQGWKAYQIFVGLSRKKGQVGKRFQSQIKFRPTRGRPSYIKTPMYMAKDLPPGLSFQSGTGTISGIPVEPGEFNIRVGVRDAKRGTHSGRTWYLETFYLKIKKFNDLK
ncbi:MAG: Ig domain-containing protein [Planctomycetota bacterium]|nr:Ig domain-containing protein [Planctomycetota bacterium]